MTRGEPSSWIRWSAAVVSTALILAGSVAPSAEQASGQPRAVFRQGTELILVNVVVRDTRGVVVRGLTKNDFSILEDNKPQTISTFDFEDLSTPATSRPGATSPPLPVILGAPRQTVAPSPLAHTTNQERNFGRPPFLGVRLFEDPCFGAVSYYDAVPPL